MLNEQQVRERLATLERELVTARQEWRSATERDIRGELPNARMWNEDPQMLNGQITALESAIEELRIVLEETSD